MMIEQEALRLYPAEAITERMAVEDASIPLSDGITTSKGELISHLPVRKGQIVNLGIASYQRFVGWFWWVSGALSFCSYSQTGITLGGRRARIQTLSMARWWGGERRGRWSLRESVGQFQFSSPSLTHHA
jgi:hypothetical protein